MQNKQENIAILVDYDNIFIAMEQYYRDFTQPLLPYTVIASIKNHYSRNNIIIYNLYADLQNIKISYTGFNTLNDCDVDIKHIAHGKNSGDIVLLLDCMKILQHYHHISKIVIVSSDSDMTPIYKECKLNNVDLEIVYIEAITAETYIQKLNQAQIRAHSIESLLGIPTANVNMTTQELFAYITQNRDYLQGLLTQVNSIIKNIYEKYYKQDKQGHVSVVGATSLLSLGYHLKDKHVLPDNLTTHSQNNSLIIDTLIEYNIIVPINYSFRDKIFETWILSSLFMQKYHCTIPGAIDKTDFEVLSY